MATLKTTKLTYAPQDKKVESARYNERATKFLQSNESTMFGALGALHFPRIFRKPYIKYEWCHRTYIKDSFDVLEIGAGTGTLTKSLLDSGANVIATDISPNSLKIIQKRYVKFGKKLIIKVADMEKLPFDDNNFDVVSSAGSLSYGSNEVVMNEISRILKQDGLFICVDSLNHNLVYKFNRWISYIRGKRTFSTLQNMPTLSLIEKYKKNFEVLSLDFYGSLVWIYPFMRLFVGANNATNLIDKFDNIINTSRSGFKFVVVFRKKI